MNGALLRFEFYKLWRRPWGILLVICLALVVKGSVFMAAKFGAFGWIENGFAYLSLSAKYSLFLASFLLAILAASSISGEYAAGLLRMQLARPVSRSAYFLQRTFFLCFIALLVVVLDAVLGILVGWGGYGFPDVANPALQGPQFGASAMAWSAFKSYGFSFLGLAGLLCLGLLISALFTTPTVAIGMAAALFFLMKGIEHLFREPMASYVITRYTTVHLDHLSKLARGIAEYQPPDLWMKSLVVPLVYILLTIGIGLYFFRRRDVLE